MKKSRRSWKTRSRYLAKMEVRKWDAADVVFWNRRYPKIIRKRRNRNKQNRLKLRAYANMQFARSMYIEDCRYHPCLVTQLDIEGTSRLDFDCVSLVNNKPNSCSYYHCGILHLSEEDAFQRRDDMLLLGMLPYMIKYQVLGSIRPEFDRKEVVEKYCIESIEMEQVWGFDESQEIPECTDAGACWLNENCGVDYLLIKEITAIRSPV